MMSDHSMNLSDMHIDLKSMNETTDTVRTNNITKVQHLDYIQSLYRNLKQKNKLLAKDVTPIQKKNKENNYVPPCEKYKLLQLEKNIWIEINQKKKQEEDKKKEMKGVTFHPKISEYTQELYKGRKRTPTDVYDEMTSWKKKTDKQLQQLKQEQLEKQKTNYTFRPNFYQKSLNMVENGHFYDRLEEKQIIRQIKLNQIRREITPSFKPFLLSKHSNQNQLKGVSHSPNHQLTQSNLDLSFSNNNNNKSLIKTLTEEKNQTKKSLMDSFMFFETIRRQQSPIKEDQLNQSQRSRVISMHNFENQSNQLPADSAIFKMMKNREELHTPERVASFGGNKSSDFILTLSLEDQARNERIADLIQKLDKEIQTRILHQDSPQISSPFTSAYMTNEKEDRLSQKFPQLSTINDSFGPEDSGQ